MAITSVTVKDIFKKNYAGPSANLQKCISLKGTFQGEIILL